MASIPEFKAPDFVENEDAATIQTRMMSNLPADIDDTEGGFPWDFTKPTALEKAELIGYELTQTLQIMFPMWAYNYWLDYHAQAHNLTRKPANAATGTLTITGTAGKIIPKGFVFAAPAVGGQPSVEYTSDAECTIGVTGTIDVAITASEAGIIGNVSPETISIMSVPLAGIVSITNAIAVTGGTKEEEDEALRTRIMDVIGELEASFVGSKADYKRWAQEVTGVGKAIVIPEWDGAGTVKIIVIDSNGEPANSTIVTNVYNYIFSPTDEEKRKSPIGAQLTVVAPTPIAINYVFLLTLVSEATTASVVAAFTANLLAYYSESKEDGVIKYNRIASILTDTDGVKDFTGLTINAGTANILIDDDKCPVTGTINTTGGV